MEIKSQRETERHREGERERERGKQWRGMTQERERERERERKEKTLASCYSRVSKMTLHSSKDVKYFKSSMLDVDDILRALALKNANAISKAFLAF